MGIYSTKDIKLTLDGDLEVSSSGDIAIADGYETVKGVVNFLLMTDQGEFVPNRRLGCNLGTYIGDNINSLLLANIEASVKDNLVKFIIGPSDLIVHAIPLDHENVGILVKILGTFLDSNGNVITQAVSETLTYLFPFYSSDPKLVLIN